jgi:hypothetical protein
MISNLITAARIACLMLLVLHACHSQNSNQPATSDAKPVQVASPSAGTDLLTSGVFDDKPLVLKAWLDFIKDGHYRAAKGEDFKFSEAARSELWSMFQEQWYPRVNHPAITGNISRRNVSKDLAIIVVDNKKSDPARFGLVIFNLEPNGKETSFHWLFRNRDLSTALLSWYSNWPVLVFYQEDGSADPYYINWNVSTKSYFLDKAQVGPGSRPGRLKEKPRLKGSTSAD